MPTRRNVGFAFSPDHPIAPVSSGSPDVLVLLGALQRLLSRLAHDYLLLTVDFIRGV